MTPIWLSVFEGFEVYLRRDKAADRLGNEGIQKEPLTWVIERASSVSTLLP